MSKIVPMTLFEHPGFMILDPDEKQGIFAWRDTGSRPRKRKVKGKGPLQVWDKIWFASTYKSDRYPDMPWRYAVAGGKYPFCKMHFDAHQFVLFFDFIPFLYQEWFGAKCPWNTAPVEIKKEFKPKTEDDEVARLERERARLMA